MKYYTSLDLNEHLDKYELKSDTYYYELVLNKKHELKTLNKIFNDKIEKTSESEFETVSNYVKTLSQADWTYLEQKIEQIQILSQYLVLKTDTI